MMTGDEVREALAEGRRNFAGVDLRWADLRNADSCKADLRGADLRGTDLYNADLDGTNLSNADLRWADLRNADLCKADLRGANLRGANLRGADLRGADLNNADLTDATWDETTTWPFAGLVPERSGTVAEEAEADMHDKDEELAAIVDEAVAQTRAAQRAFTVAYGSIDEHYDEDTWCARFGMFWSGWQAGQKWQRQCCR